METIGFALLGGLSVALLFWAIAAPRRKDAVTARLEALGTTDTRSLEERELEAPLLDRTLRPLLARVARRSKRSMSAAKGSKIEQNLAKAGLAPGMRASDWVAIRYTIAGGILVVATALLSLLAGDPLLGILFGAGLAFFGYVFSNIWLGRRIKARQKAILLQIPDTLDLLTVSVRAGLGFDAALSKVVEKMDGPLIDEFQRALADIRVGMTRREALRAITERTNCRPLNNFIGAIIQAEQLGVSISKVLQVQSEQLRIGRRQAAEEAAAKSPIKMLLPLVGCIFPALFIVILGPALIMIIRNMGSGGF